MFKSKNLLTINDVLDTYRSREYGIKALSNYNSWFPIKSSPRLAGIVGDLIGDGHLQDYPKLRLDYTSKSIMELKRFNQEIFLLFGINGKIRDCTTNKYNTKNLGINNKPLARVLKLLGVPTGAKVLKRFFVPKWILMDKELFSRFINRLFSCEGCVDMGGKSIIVDMYKSSTMIEDGIKFFEDIGIHLDKYFQIKATFSLHLSNFNIRKDGIKTQSIVLKIKKKESLLNFQKFIDFDDEMKKRKLNLIINLNIFRF